MGGAGCSLLAACVRACPCRRNSTLAHTARTSTPPHTHQFLAAAPGRHWRREQRRRWTIIPPDATLLRLYCLALFGLLALPLAYQALELALPLAYQALHSMAGVGGGGWGPRPAQQPLHHQPPLPLAG